METTMLILEIIGTIAFAVSGALAATRHSLDILGIIIVAVTTAVGGGAIRDLTVGITPPTVFTNPIYLIVALLTCVVFIIWQLLIRSDWKLWKKIPAQFFEKAFNLTDAIGLGVFTVSGAAVAAKMGHQNNFVLVIFVGAITGVGGGILRDLFTGQIPAIFTKHIYALASLIGAITYYFLRTAIDRQAAMLLVVVLVVIIRQIGRASCRERV